jgi:hypothetical protein
MYVHTPVIYTQTHNRILVIKKNEIMPFTRKWMELESMIMSKICQEQESKYHMFSPFVEPRPKIMIMLIIIMM